ncbi:MAG TPA: TolC family outer membrane protein [Albitalea sp.]|nr:TolC family outer membrane protein [Albitalea sp.]
MRLALSMLLAGASLSAGAANLDDIYQLARDNDAQYAAAREAWRAGLEKLEQAKSLGRPTLTLSANVRANEDYSSQTGAQPAYGSNSATLSFVQPLVRLQNVQALAQGELQVQLAEEQLRQAEQDLMLRVGKAYFDALQAEDVLASLRAQKEAFTQQLAQTRRSLQVGTVAITDVNEAQTKYDLTVAQEIAGRNDAEVKRQALERIINRPLPPLARWDETRRIELGPADQLSALIERAGSDSLAVSIARINRDLAQREATKQDVSWLPSVDMTATANNSRNVASPGILQRYNTRQSAVGLELSWPIFQGGAISSRQREAAANLTKAGFDLDNARRQAMFDARQAYLNAMSGAAQVTALEQALASSESQVKSTRRGLEVGVRTRLDVLNAEQQFHATRRDLAVARYQTLIASLQLKAAANTLSEQDLRALDASLKP